MGRLEKEGEDLPGKQSCGENNKGLKAAWGVDCRVLETTDNHRPLEVRKGEEEEAGAKGRGWRFDPKGLVSRCFEENDLDSGSHSVGQGPPGPSTPSQGACEFKTFS